MEKRDTAEKLRSEIAHLRGLAANVMDERVRAAIQTMIEELEERLEKLPDLEALARADTSPQIY